MTVSNIVHKKANRCIIKIYMKLQKTHIPLKEYMVRFSFIKTIRN